MTKLVSTRERVAIITDLLVKPNLLGKLGRVVTRHCGGNVKRPDISAPQQAVIDLLTAGKELDCLVYQGRTTANRQGNS